MKRSKHSIFLNITFESTEHGERLLYSVRCGCARSAAWWALLVVCLARSWIIFRCNKRERDRTLLDSFSLLSAAPAHTRPSRKHLLDPVGRCEQYSEHHLEVLLPEWSLGARTSPLFSFSIDPIHRVGAQ